MKLAALWLVVMLFLSLSVSPVSSVEQEALSEGSASSDNYMLLDNWVPQENPNPVANDPMNENPASPNSVAVSNSFDVSAWAYRMPITINNAGGALTDYQVLVTMDTAGLISAGKMQPDGDDIRFTDSDGTTLLSYWVESGVNTISTKIWVKVPSIPGSATKTIYMYYGNSAAEPGSNGATTFNFFDDFLTHTWDDTRGAWTATVFDGRTVLQSGATGGTMNQNTMKYIGDMGQDWAVELCTYWDRPVGGYGRYWSLVFSDIGADSTPLNSGYVGLSSELHWGRYDKHILGRGQSGDWDYYWAVEGGAPNRDAWARQTLKKFGGNVGYTDAVTVSGTDPSPLTTFAYLTLHHNTEEYRIGYVATGKLNVDWVLVRRYVEPEPTVTLELEEPTDTTPPVSSVEPFEGDAYWKELELGQSFTVSAVAVDDLSGVDKVELWYRYSMDGWTDQVAWKKQDWQLYDVDINGGDEWSWSFDAPYGYGYYEFFSIATDWAGNSESEDEKRLEPGEAGCRVAKNLVRTVAIMSKPEETPLILGLTKEYYTSIAEDMRRYYDEVSYGALAIKTVDIYDKGGEWYHVVGSVDDYRESFDSGVRYNNDFLKRSIDMADVDVNYGLYDIVIVLGGGLAGRAEYGYIEWELLPLPHQVLREEYTTGSGEVAKCPIRIYEPSSTGIWAHEVGHALGKLLTGEPLPDLYEGSWSWGSAIRGEITGDLEGWGLMGNLDTAKGTVRFPVHLSSWSKERLEWLIYDDFATADHLNVWVLPTLKYNAGVARWSRWDLFGDTSFIFETRSPNYGVWDVGIPIQEGDETALVVYKIYDPRWIGDTQVTTVQNLAANRMYFLPGEEQVLFPPNIARPGIKLHVNDGQVWGNSYYFDISVKEVWWASGFVALFDPAHLLRRSWFGSSSPPTTDNMIWPDLDLHAYTSDGLHVGVNYETNEYEIQIPGAIASGDFYNSSEWIFVPDNVEAYFIISSRDTTEFTEANLGVLENENGLYTLTITYFDDNGVGHDSYVDNQLISPAAEMFHAFQIQQNPDGTYSIVVEEGMDLLSIEAWRAAIENIPNNIFINQPNNRKNALKNKFEAVFNMIEENNYSEAIQKLGHDILEKLDADGRADWVREPKLIDGINVFIATLQ